MGESVSAAERVNTVDRSEYKTVIPVKMWVVPEQIFY